LAAASRPAIHRKKLHQPGLEVALLGQILDGIAQYLFRFVNVVHMRVVLRQP